MVSYYAVSVVHLLVNPFDGFDGGSEFVELSGRQAKRKMREWPAAVSENDVQRVSRKHEFNPDSNSAWYRVRLSKGAAIAWQNHIHLVKENGPQQYVDNFYEGYEGINRSVLGPPPQHWQTGETPNWWKPPAIDFRATEVMVWYRDYNSGVGQAVYSGFDPNTSELWIYDYSCQHDDLWEHGAMPDGDSFGSVAP